MFIDSSFKSYTGLFYLTFFNSDVHSLYKMGKNNLKTNSDILYITTEDSIRNTKILKTPNNLRKINPVKLILDCVQP